MKRGRDLVNSSSVQIHRTDAPANECARLDCAAQTNEANMIGILDSEFVCQLRGNLDEHLRLELGEMAQVTTHPAGGMMFGQAIGGEHVREARIARRCDAVNI